ncbi:Putative lysozyme [Hydrogenophaga intermedia]|uniref:Putative lysozyme n=1 Tax=Hydrogenophaga intermedia TaxID=65786 RepID=A0A1L1PH70_HYDIT|nr:glycoside hydrolase family 19 protein [Hydrogenophaga intermedia]CDN87333.1 Putative lysozyme [Hydrogenophaga intermedia]
MKLVADLIDLGVTPTQARAFAEPLHAAMALHHILTPQRRAAFLAHAVIETARLSSLEENLRYSDPERIARIFRTGFDLDGDRVVDPEEIEFAKGFVRQPEKLANRAYANRNGNGDEASGDGWRYRGRGIFQLTGRANYRDASVGVGLGAVYLHKPELVAQPTDACVTAAWYWVTRGCNQMIDAGDFAATTRAINGKAMLHHAERLALFEEGLQVLAA